LLSTKKSDKIKGWQYVIGHPACFTGNTFDVAMAEIEFLKNQNKQ
jgi:hypothetical protein